jgi:NAD(P)-dependent dehydrogenase (short-subunit alcohol dehydrogenase family)
MPATSLRPSSRRRATDATFTECDITDIARYQRRSLPSRSRNGPALALVNNAANDLRHKWNEVTPEFWDKAIAVNLKHAFFAAQAVIPGMIAAGRGSIVNFGSISWMILTGNLAAYTASKAAMHGMSRSLARDARQARHPRQHAGPRLDHDRAAAHALGRPGREPADRRAAGPQGAALSRRHRPHGAVPRRRRQPR